MLRHGSEVFRHGFQMLRHEFQMLRHEFQMLRQGASAFRLLPAGRSSPVPASYPVA